MWITCYVCYGSGYNISKKNINILSEEKNKKENCSFCERYRITEENYQFYGHIWIEDDYEISTPPSSP